MSNRSPKNSNSPERDARIVELHKQGVPVKAIAVRVGLTRRSVYGILQKEAGR